MKYEASPPDYRFQRKSSALDVFKAFMYRIFQYHVKQLLTYKIAILG